MRRGDHLKQGAEQDKASRGSHSFTPASVASAFMLSRRSSGAAGQEILGSTLRPPSASPRSLSHGHSRGTSPTVICQPLDPTKGHSRRRRSRIIQFSPSALQCSPLTREQTGGSGSCGRRLRPSPRGVTPLRAGNALRRLSILRQPHGCTDGTSKYTGARSRTPIWPLPLGCLG